MNGFCYWRLYWPLLWVWSFHFLWTVWILLHQIVATNRALTHCPQGGRWSVAGPHFAFEPFTKPRHYSLVTISPRSKLSLHAYRRSLLAIRYFVFNRLFFIDLWKIASYSSFFWFFGVDWVIYDSNPLIVPYFPSGRQCVSKSDPWTRDLLLTSDMRIWCLIMLQIL